MLRTRVVTALVALPLLAVAIIHEYHPVFAGVVVGASAAAAYEFFQMALPAHAGARRVGVVLAILVAAGGILLPARHTVAQLAIDHDLPGIAAFKEFPRAGLLASYGPDLPEINRRAASYVDRIIKGANPGDLPIELPSKHELVVNVATARALRLSVPPSLLLRADEVVQ